MRGLSFLLALCLIILSDNISVVSQSHASSLNAILDKSTNESAIQAEQVEFLKVDEAFVFSSENQKDGIKLNWEIADEYYLYKERFKFKVVGHTSPDSVELGDPQYSNSGKAKEDPYFGLVHVIHKHVEVFLPISLKDGAKEAEIKVSYQGCAEAGLCYPPKHQKLLFISDAASADSGANINSGSSANSQQSSITQQAANNSSSTQRFDSASNVFSFIENSHLASIIGIFFLLGIGLTFTPCVFPMIPIITSIIAGQEKPTLRKSFILALSYVLGMAITYAAAGVITGLLGASANVQAALQDPVLISIFAGLFVLLALSMFGLYELQLPAFVRDRLNTTSQNLSGGHIFSVFFIGALSALVVSPCVSAPLAGALLYISTTGDAVIGGASLFALGLGMGVPLILIAVGGGKFLPKAGAWMDTIKHIFGVMLIAVAIWLLARVISESITMILWAILFGLVGTQMGAFDKAEAGWQRLFKGAGLLLALYAAILMIGALSGGKDPLQPLAKLNTQITEQTQTKSTLNFTTITSLQELEQQLDLAKTQNKPILLDFYADWCISCKVMESQVFPLPEIEGRMKSFHLVKADVTDNSEANKALMNRFNLFGPPSILFFDSQGNEIKQARIVGEITKNAYQDILDLALERRT